MSSVLDVIKNKIAEVDTALAARLGDLDGLIQERLARFEKDSEKFWQDVATEVEAWTKLGGSAAGKVEKDYPGDDEK